MECASEVDAQVLDSDICAVLEIERRDKTGEEQVGPVAVDREIIDTVELECYAFQALVVVGDELVFLYLYQLEF